MQQQIINSLGVVKHFNAVTETPKLVSFLANYLRQTGLHSFVVGVSGGVDSLAAGLLAREAVRQLQTVHSYQAQLITVRLPYGTQADAAEANACVQLMQASQNMVVNIQAATDNLMQALLSQGLVFNSTEHQDLINGNIKARQRMVALFAVAGAQAGIVVGTDNAAESLVGFSTKYGDNAADIMPLAQLSKRMVRAVASHLGAPDYLVNKVPTADLESLSPQRPDEVAIGVSYSNIDSFLEGNSVPAQDYERILHLWRASAHKRNLPVVPSI